jgi:hypothetical protein
MTIFQFLINSFDAIVLGAPLYFGLSLLSGNLRKNANSYVRNIFGVSVIIFGFIVGNLFQILRFSFLRVIFGL